MALTLAQQQAIALASARARAAAPSGQQPTFMQDVAASPVGRLVHDAVVQPVEGMASLALKAIPGANLIAPAFDKSTQQVAEAPYRDALSAQRNVPGYAEARSAADRVTAKRGVGFTDQITAPFNSAMAGAVGGMMNGSMTAANAASDSQESAQADYQKQHPYLAMAGQVLGGLAAAPEAAKVPMPKILPKTAKPFIPSIDDLKAAAGEEYRNVDNSGVSVSADAMNGMADSLQDKFGRRLDPTLHPDSTAVFNRASQYATDGSKGSNPATFTEVDNLRRVVSDAAKAVKPADKELARQMRDHIDAFVNNLGPNDLDTTAQDAMRADLISATSAKGRIAAQIKAIEANKSGALAARGAAGSDTRALYMKLRDDLATAEQQRLDALGSFKSESDLLNAGPQQTVNSLNQARDLWSRASQAGVIQKQLEKANIKAGQYSQSGMENATRAQFRQLALNDKAMARLSPEVQAAVKQVAAGTATSNTLRFLGKFAPHGPVSTAISVGLGGTIGGLPGAMALPIAGEAARFGASALTKSAAQRAMDAALLGKTSMPRLNVPPLQIPSLTPASTLPYGLFGSMGYQPQPQ